MPVIQMSDVLRENQKLKDRVRELEAVAQLALEWAEMDHPGGSFLANQLREVLTNKSEGVADD